MFHGTGERNQGLALLMMVNKPETALYRAPTFSLLLPSHGGMCSLKYHTFTSIERTQGLIMRVDATHMYYNISIYPIMIYEIQEIILPPLLCVCNEP